METITGMTRGGGSWTPSFIVEINQNLCLGCGRCFKVCTRKVFELIERECDEDEDDDYDDDVMMVMAVADANDCIGCEACARVCARKAHSHAPAQLSA